MESFVLELILTVILLFVILNVSTGAAEKGITAGAVIGLEAMFAGPVCGASMNPARSLAPAVVSQHLSSLWIYLIAPPLGVLVAVLACRCVRANEAVAGLHVQRDLKTDSLRKASDRLLVSGCRFIDERPQPQPRPPVNASTCSTLSGAPDMVGMAHNIFPLERLVHQTQ
jgi:hypothetical protein